jgi:glycosyltransferase involved in cell wall biosynthesis
MPDKNKKLLLYISAHLPSLSVPQAGHKTAYSLLKEYSLNFEIIAVFFLNPGESFYFEEKDYSFCRAVYTFRVNNLTRLAGLFSNPLLPVSESMRKSKQASLLIKSLQKENDFDSVHFEFTASACYLDVINPGIRKIFSEHDLTYQALERKSGQAKGLWRLIYLFEYLRQKKWELDIIRQMEEIWVHNSKDRLLLLQEKIPDDMIKVIMPYVNPVFKTARRGFEEKESIIFWGAMDRGENRDAAEWFVKDIFPGITGKKPGAKLYIVGANPSESLKKLGNNNIIITGFVEDPLPYFEKAKLAVAPLRLGAGVKVKVLEALSAGLPVVATSVGAEGITHENLFIADEIQEFIKSVLEIIK